MTALDRFRLDGKVALVAGAGRGIGAATALALADAGADVAVLSRTATQIDAVAEQARGFGRRALAIPTDAGDADAVASAVARTVDELGRLDVVVSVVGGSYPKPFLATSDRSLGIAFERNVVDGLRLVRATVPHLLKSDVASIVMISSAVGHVTGRGFVAYGATKAALDHAVRMLSLELNPTIRINAVAPGAIMTEALEMVAAESDIVESLAAHTPLGRVGDPDDIAAAVLFLASPAGAYMTGQILAVDGGLVATNLETHQPDLIADA
jgi:7-alpha-hydroxysteroid dehydrogenase